MEELEKDSKVKKYYESSIESNNKYVDDASMCFINRLENKLNYEGLEKDEYQDQVRNSKPGIYFCGEEGWQ